MRMIGARTLALAVAIIGLNAPSSGASLISISFGTQACGQVGDSGAFPLTFAFTCDDTNSSAHVKAEGSLTTMRVALDYDAAHDGGPPGLSSTRVGGGVVVSDSITMSGGVVGSAGVLQVNWVVDGTLVANGTGDFTLALFEHPSGTPVAEWRACGATNTLCGGFASVATNETVSVLLPFVFGTPLQTTFGLRGGTSGGAMNFYNTAQLQPLVVFDGNGGQIHGASAISDSGFRYAVAGALPSVPEPASLLLLGTGLVAAGVAKRKRR